MLFALGQKLHIFAKSERLMQSVASIRSRHRSCRTSKETERGIKMQQVKSVRTILVRGIECAWANQERESRGRKSNARGMEERLLPRERAAGKGFNSNVGQALSCVCERAPREQHWAIILIGGEESSTSSDRWPSGFIAADQLLYPCSAHSISLVLPAWLSANRRHTLSHAQM